MSINETIKPKKGRPSVDSEAVNLRVNRQLLAEIDSWRAEQRPIPTRPEAIRCFMTIGLQAKPLMAALHGVLKALERAPGYDGSLDELIRSLETILNQ